MTDHKEHTLQAAYEKSLRELGRLKAEQVNEQAELRYLKTVAKLKEFLNVQQPAIKDLLALIAIGDKAGSLSHDILLSPILHRGYRITDLISEQGTPFLSVQESLRSAVGRYIEIGASRWHRVAQEMHDIESNLHRAELPPNPEAVAAVAKDREAEMESLSRDFAQAPEDLSKLLGALSNILQQIQTILDSRQWKIGMTVSRCREILSQNSSYAEAKRLAATCATTQADFLQIQERLRKGGVACLSQEPTAPTPAPPPYKSIEVTIPLSASKISYTHALPPELSIIILNRNGARHLTNFFRSFLAHNSFSRLEFVVVDHASTDESIAILKEFQKQLPIKLIEAAQNFSFSHSNNRAVADVTGEKLLFLNNDIIFSADIIPPLIAELRRDPEALIGCDLYYPKLSDSAPSGIIQGPLQHSGILFQEDIQRRLFRPCNVQDAHAAASPAEGAVSLFPAATAAALCCHRETFLKVGGFCEEYNYGYEDVDFCLSYLTHYGRPVKVIHLAGLLHNESATQEKDPEQEVTERRRANIATLQKRYGRMIRRAIQSDLIESKKLWSNRVLRVGFAVTECGADATAGDYFTALELGEALTTEFGWEIEFLPRLGGSKSWYDVTGIDVLISMLDGYDINATFNESPNLIRIAWMRNWFARWAERSWFSCYDIFLCSSEKAARYIRNKSFKDAKVLRIATNEKRFTPGPSEPQFSCDYCFVGGYFGANRDIESSLKPSEINARFRLYGSGWADHLDLEQYFYGPLPYKDVASLYRSSKIVLDDANHVTKSWASVNSRVFDALAVGCLVITNGKEGAMEVFGEDLPVYHSPEELQTLVSRYLSDEELRAETVARCREIVLRKNTYRHRAHEFKEILTDFTRDKLRFSIKVPAPSHHEKHQWGDFHFATAIREELQLLGHSVRIDILPEWDTPRGLGDDVVLVLRGLSRYALKPGALHLMWNISHPELVQPEEYNEYDFIFIASDQHAEQLRKKVKAPIAPLLQCTNPRVFFEEVDTRIPAHELLFVGNSRKHAREIVIDSIACELPLAVYGSLWEGIIPPDFLKGTHVPNSQLRKYYSRAALVLNDHWREMKECGFISNRIFDAGACGACVLSDNVEGLQKLFGDAVTVYGKRSDLKDKVEKLLSNETLRREKGIVLRKIVLEKHTFLERTKRILQTSQQLLKNPSNGANTQIASEYRDTSNAVGQ